MVFYSRGRGFDSHPDQRLFSVLGRKKFLILLISKVNETLATLVEGDKFMLIRLTGLVLV